MIEVNYITLLIIGVVYFIALGFIFWKLDTYCNLKRKISMLEFELKIRDILINDYMKKGK